MRERRNERILGRMKGAHPRGGSGAAVEAAYRSAVRDKNRRYRGNAGGDP